jgi:cyanophycinase
MRERKSEPMGHLLLQGGAEFKGRMAASDRAALALCGGPEAPVFIIPTAAVPDSNHQRAGGNGERWFRSLGAVRVHVLDLVDRRAANDPAIAAELEPGSLIYMLGGFPGFLARTLAGSVVWSAIRAALDRGAILAGSSAGAMVLCDHFYDPAQADIATGLGVLPNACVLPHHDTFGRQWVAHLRPRMPQATLIGIDEETGVIGHLEENEWMVYGRGAVTLYRPDGVTARFADGTVLSL